MNKVADFLLIQAISFLLTLMIASYCGVGIALSLLIALAVMIFLGLSVNIIASVRGDKYISYADYCLLCRLNGDEWLRKEVAAVMSCKFDCEIRGSGVMCGSTYIHVNGKFSAISSDALAAIYRQAKSDSLTYVGILQIGKDNRALSLSRRINDVKIEFLSFKKFYKLAVFAKRVPAVKPRHINRRRILIGALPFIFGRGNAIRFVVVSLILTLMSYITPMKTYYLTVAAIAAAAAILCLILPISAPLKENIFKRPPKLPLNK
ncbi:MAG: hypothetical protein HFH71_05440 [Clostridia bacterium]|nr:hypothetical protein [Clostridia bacterium]